MFKNIGNTRICGILLTAVAFTLSCSVGATGTVLNFIPGSQMVYGGSETASGGYDLDYCTNWVNVDVNYHNYDLCLELHRLSYTSGTEGLLSYPAGQYSQYQADFTGPFTQVTYSFTYPGSGTWYAHAVHWSVENDQTCTANYNMINFPNPNWSCADNWSTPTWLTDSDDSAVVY